MLAAIGLFPYRHAELLRDAEEDLGQAALGVHGHEVEDRGLALGHAVGEMA